MSTQSPWRPSYSRNPDEPLEIHEELDSPPRRRGPIVAVAVVALLAGLALGNLSGTSARDLAEVTTELQVRTGELEAAQAELERLGDRTELLRSTLSEESRARTRAEEGLEAVTRASAALVGHPGSGAVSPRSTGVVARAWVRDLFDGDAAAARSLYADNAMATVSQNNVQLDEGEGAEQVAAAVWRALSGEFRVTTPVMGSGQFAAFGYATADLTGVTVLQVSDRQIARQWVYLDGRF